MQSKIGVAGQIINFNYVHNFIAQNFNKLLWNTFTPGVLKLTITNVGNEITISDFSALIRPRNQNFLIKIDTMESFKLVATNITKPWLVARMDWLTPPNGYEYDSVKYGDAGQSGYSGYSGYFYDPLISCSLNSETDLITSAYHNLVTGDIIRFNTSVAGIISDIDYYVIEIPTENTFTVSTTATGEAIDLTSVGNVTVLGNSYRKMNTHIVRFDMIAEADYDSVHDITLGQLIFTSGIVTSIDTLYQTQVYLNNNCINYDTVEWGYSEISGFSGWGGTSGYSGFSGPRTLSGSNSNFIGLSGWSGISGIYEATDSWIERFIGHSSGYIPVSDGVINLGLNSQYVNGVKAGNEDNSIGIKNTAVCKNMIASRLFLNGIEYGLGQSGISGYSSFSGYTGYSGWSDASGYKQYYSGYIPINNTALQTSLNVEYLGGYGLTDYSLSGHSHYYDNILDGETFFKIDNVGESGLLSASGITDGSLKYKHQSTTTPFRYDNTTKKKIFVLTGQTGEGGSMTINFQSIVFSGKPRVFLLNDWSDEWKSVKEDDIKNDGTGFTITHYENTKSDPSGLSGYLVSDTTEFLTYWIAIGEKL